MPIKSTSLQEWLNPDIWIQKMCCWCIHSLFCFHQRCQNRTTEQFIMIVNVHFQSSLLLKLTFQQLSSLYNTIQYIQYNTNITVYIIYTVLRQLKALNLDGKGHCDHSLAISDKAGCHFNFTEWKSNVIYNDRRGDALQNSGYCFMPCVKILG